MFNQNRIYRLFRLINFLKAKPAKSIRSIMNLLDTSERTVYRYVDMLRDIGFQVEKDNANRLWIYSEGNGEMPPLTEQEADYLERLIQTTGRQL